MCSAAMLNLCCARLKLRLRLKSTWTPPRPSWSEPPKVRHHHEELEEQRAPPDLGHLPIYPQAGRPRPLPFSPHGLHPCKYSARTVTPHHLLLPQARSLEPHLQHLTSLPLTPSQGLPFWLHPSGLEARPSHPQTVFQPADEEVAEGHR